MKTTHYEIYNAFTEEQYLLCEFDDSFTNVAEVDKTLARSIELVAADRHIHAEDLAARQITEDAFNAERFVTQEFYSLLVESPVLPTGVQAGPTGPEAV